MFNNLPATMRTARRWMLWKAEPNSDPAKKPRKVPYYTDGTRRTGELDSPADTAKLAPFDAALAAVNTGNFTGLGFALGPDGTGNHWQGVDLDDLPSRPSLASLSKELPGYTETSPSGNGVHAIGYGRLFSSLGSNSSGIEAYAHGRYFTVTGDGPGSDVTCLADFVEQRLKPLHSPKPSTLQSEPSNRPSTSAVDVTAETIAELRSALFFMHAHDRDLWQRTGHALKTLGDVGRSLWLEWSATSDKFDPVSDVRTWESFRPNRTDYRAVFAEAQRQGWEWPEPQSFPEGAYKTLVVVGIHDFLSRELPTREAILSPWMLTQSLNMIYAWRGVGKTHVALRIAFAIASGEGFLGWNATTPRKVLYVDGEMPAPALQARLAAIATSSEKEPAKGMLSLITPDLQNSFMPDLATIEGQAAVNAAIEEDTELIIIDNLSCLVRRGGRENDAESWLTVSEWALAKRAQGKSILFIHHSNKSGAQRGTSKREDLLDVVICLKRPPNYEPSDGAVFEVHFEKARHLCGEETNPFEARLTEDEHGRQKWLTKPVIETTFDRVVELAGEGLKQSEIADELGVNRSTVCRAYRKATEQGLIGKTQKQLHQKGGNDD